MDCFLCRGLVRHLLPQLWAKEINVSYEKKQIDENSKVLTRDVPLRLLPLGSSGLFERGQGGFLLLKGSPHVLESHLLLLEGLTLFPEGPGERNHGHLLVEELGLLLLERGAEALQLSALRLSLLSSFLERRPKALQLGSLRLGLLGLLLRCRPLDVPLTNNPLIAH